MARVDESIGFFVADICTVAEWEDLSHCDMSVIMDQSALVSSNGCKSLWTVMKQLITL